jgi:hypothetical protein
MFVSHAEACSVGNVHTHKCLKSEIPVIPVTNSGVVYPLNMANKNIRTELASLVREVKEEEKPFL